MTIGDSSYWDDFFQQNLIPSVLSYVIATWEQMPMPGPSDFEDAISVKLYSALINAKDPLSGCRGRYRLGEGNRKERYCVFSVPSGGDLPVP